MPLRASPVLLIGSLLLGLGLACGGDGGGKDLDTGYSDNTGGGGNGGGGGDADCASTASDIPQDVKDAIATTCDVAVNCGAWTCDACVTTFEDSFRSLDKYSQATYADALLCLSTIECDDWMVGDFSDCTGNSCGGIWCGSDSSICADKGCGSCGYDGYCGY